MWRILLIIPLIFCFCQKEESGGGSGGGGGGGGGSGVTAVDLLPQDGEISGWNRDGSYQLATTYQELYDIIDGEAQTYVDHGFVEAVFQDYKGQIQGEDVDLEVRIFDMATNDNAKSVYDAVASGAETPWTDNNPGVEARIDESALFAYVIDFWQERFFVRVTIGNKTEEGLNVAKQFCYNISAAIGE